MHRVGGLALSCSVIKMKVACKKQRPLTSCLCTVCDIYMKYLNLCDIKNSHKTKDKVTDKQSDAFSNNGCYIWMMN